MSAAKHADILFVKVGPEGDNDLAAYCVQQGIAHIKFKKFSDALDLVKKVVTGELSVEQARTFTEV
jgi:2-hydroxy-3-keto-5-methylthiopentenyl-1-phosphate phosphatase